MPETLPRPLIALTVIVAAIAIYTGVKDHYDQKKQAAAATTISEADASAKHDGSTKKIHSRKTKGSRRAEAVAVASGATKKSGADAPASGNDIAHQLVRDEYAQASALAKAGTGSEQDAAETDGQQEQAGGMQDRKRKGSREFDASLSPECLPLPNMTKPGDVDAPYYENWAKEYCGR